jgi:hypothetical protein
MRQHGWTSIAAGAGSGLTAQSPGSCHPAPHKLKRGLVGHHRAELAGRAGPGAALSALEQDGAQQS